jgi:hypothetical protein
MSTPRLPRPRWTLVSTAGLAAVALVALAGLTLQRRSVAQPNGTSLPALITPKTRGVIVLFSGKGEEMKQNFVFKNGQPADWKLVDGAMQTRNGDIVSKQEFDDAIYHVEFKVPLMPEAKGQARGNSGVIIQGCYEIQILDSYGIENPGKGDCGAIYNHAAPLVNACKKPLEWQSYDIVFRSPRFDAEGKKIEPARVTVFQNGVLIQNNQHIPGSTGLGKLPPPGDYSQPGPLLLQYHGNDVQFRNVWVLPLPKSGADRY